MNTSIVGVVLCGGNSTRMGADKGMIRQGGRTWGEIAVQKLEQVIPEVYLSINALQASSYGGIFPSDKLIIDSVECKGPLAGLLSSHAAKPEKDIFLLASDMVKMDVPTLKIIVSGYENYNDVYDFYLFRRNGEYEPLAGIYTSRGIRKVFRQFQEHALGKHSMKHILEIGNAFSFDIPEADTLTNYNSQADFSQ